MVEECQKLWHGTAELRAGTRRSVDVDVDLGDGRRLTGTVAGVYGTRLCRLGYSRLKARQRLTTWIQLLALTASDPDQTGPATPSAASAPGPKRALTGPLDHRAVDWLRDLVELRDRGLTEPLPLPVATSRRGPRSTPRPSGGAGRRRDEARRASGRPTVRRRPRFPREDQDAYHVRVFGPRLRSRRAGRGRPAGVRLPGCGSRC